MKWAQVWEKLDDAINPIVVKELRQAVQSRFVVAVIMCFLAIQLIFFGIYLMATGQSGRLDAIDSQAGRDAFAWLQGLLLATGMLFLPAYSGLRLAAERQEVNTDLLFITTLSPRKIISGKLASAALIAVMIFSVCAPFMAFTYFLRGIDLGSIFFVVAIDFFVVLGSVHFTVLLAVIPGNRVFKAILAVLGFGSLLIVFVYTLSGTIVKVQLGFPPPFQDRSFIAICGSLAMSYLCYCGLTFTWSVGLISSPSANRALPMRLFMLAYCVVSFGIHLWFANSLGQQEPFFLWILTASLLVFFALMISINERETWTARVARTIPRNPLLRLPAMLVYSGAAGGVLFAL
ncbi:MAG: hypothetical protein NZO58_09505, partial [Gemmataceae bacterium]|nr:hypothetical protein [Gemmataceae bacterium]